MKIEDYRLEKIIKDDNGDPFKVELFVPKEDFRHLLDWSRILQARANRLCSEFEILDRPITMHDACEFQILANEAMSYSASVISLLDQIQNKIVQYNLLIRERHNLADVEQREIERNFVELCKRKELPDANS